MFKLLRVSGDSLSPTFQDGDFVLVSKIPYLFSPIQPGDVIAFRHHAYGTLIKLVERVMPDGGKIVVTGTYFGSVDSRAFGPIHRGAVIGKVIWHVRRPRLYRT
jgi:signal peptidase I